jgi:hypothetical protein
MTCERVTLYSHAAAACSLGAISARARRWWGASRARAKAMTWRRERPSVDLTSRALSTDSTLKPGQPARPCGRRW